MEFYREQSSKPKWNAQRNLQGRTHYVDDETLRFHKSRVLEARHIENGLFFYIITSDAVDMHNTKREFRFVIFDVFGSVVARPELGKGGSSSQWARKAMWDVLNGLDAGEWTFRAIDRQRKAHEQEMDQLNDKVTDATKEKAA